MITPIERAARALLSNPNDLDAREAMARALARVSAAERLEARAPLLGVMKGRAKHLKPPTYDVRSVTVMIGGEVVDFDATTLGLAL